MSKKIKAVDITDEAANEEPKIENAIESVEEKPKEDIEEETKEATPKNEDIKIDEIIKEEESEKPRPSRKMVTCPDCGKSMYEKNFRYQHLSVCGKVKVPKLRAKPIEEVIKEKQQKAKPVIETITKQPEVKVETVPPPPPPPEKPDYWTLRREYTNQLKERKQQLVKKLVSKAF